MEGMRTEEETITEGSDIQSSVNEISVRFTADTGASQTMVLNQVLRAFPEDTRLVSKGNLVLEGKEVPLQVGKINVKFVKEACLKEDFSKFKLCKQIDYSRCCLETSNVNGQGIKGELVTRLGQSKALKDVKLEKIEVLRSTQLSRQQADPYGAYQEPLLNPTRHWCLQSNDGELRQPDRGPCQPAKESRQPANESRHRDEESWHTDEQMCHPEEESRHPDEESRHTDEKLYQPDREPCHQDGELHQPDWEPCHQDGELHQPDREPQPPDRKLLQPDRVWHTKDKSHRLDWEPFDPGGKLYQPDDEPCHQDEETGHLDEKRRQPDGGPCQPDKTSSNYSGEMLLPDRVLRNTRDRSHHLDWEPYDPGGKPYHLDKEPHHLLRVLH